MRIPLLLEVNEVFVIHVNPDIGERAPCLLNPFASNGFLALRCALASFLQACSPGPLDLDGADMVHGKPMVLEQSSRQTHLVRGLNERSAEVLETFIFISSHVIE